jgi:hypothetical protein
MPRPSHDFLRYSTLKNSVGYGNGPGNSEMGSTMKIVQMPAGFSQDRGNLYPGLVSSCLKCCTSRDRYDNKGKHDVDDEGTAFPPFATPLIQDITIN